MNQMILNRLGSLTLDFVITSFDRPILFVCKDEKFHKYLFVEDDSNSEIESWVAIKISDEDLYFLLSKRKSIQRTFINTDVHSYFLVKHNLADDSYQCRKTDKFPDGVLANGENFVHCTQTINEQKKLLEYAQSKYKRNQMSVLDLHFNTYTRNHSLKVGFLIKLLNDVNKMFNVVVKNRSDILEVEPQPASFALHFQSRVPDKTIEANSSLTAFKIIKEILCANSPQDVKKIFIDYPRLITPTKELYSTLVKENKDFEIATIDGSGEEKFELIKSETVSEFAQKLKTAVLSDVNTNPVKGILKGYSVKKKSFDFEAFDGTVFSGKLSKSFADGHYTVLDSFNAIIETTTVIDIENSKETNSHILLKLEPLNKK